MSAATRTGTDNSSKWPSAATRTGYVHWLPALGRIIFQSVRVQLPSLAISTDSDSAATRTDSDSAATRTDSDIPVADGYQRFSATLPRSTDAGTTYYVMLLISCLS